MAESIYRTIGKEMGKDVRLVRTAAHHPFEFFSEVMEDPTDNRPMRFRYLGAFFVKPYWHKGLRSSAKEGYPEEGFIIWAKVPEMKRLNLYHNLKFGSIQDGMFVANDNSVICPVSEVKYWVKDYDSYNK
jgi:hypothetical protein